MPVADLLVLVPDIQQARLVKIITDHLQANRQAIAKPGRYRDRRQTGEIDGDRIDIRQVHTDRIIRLFTQLEGDRRCRRPHDDIDLFKGLAGNHPGSGAVPAAP